MSDALDDLADSREHMLVLSPAELRARADENLGRVDDYAPVTGVVHTTSSVIEDATGYAVAGCAYNVLLRAMMVEWQKAQYVAVPGARNALRHSLYQTGVI